MSKKIRGRIQQLTLFLATSTPVNQGPGARAPISTPPAKSLAPLAGLQRRRHRHPRLDHYRKENGCQLHRQWPLQSRVRSQRFKVVGYVSRPWVGNLIEPLVVSVGILIEQGVKTAKLV